MNLDDWRAVEGLTYMSLAELLGVSHESASRYCKGRRIPAPDIMSRIVAATAGAVQPNDFYDLPELDLDGGQAELEAIDPVELRGPTLGRGGAR